jgi:hypothetical protein
MNRQRLLLSGSALLAGCAGGGGVLIPKREAILANANIICQPNFGCPTPSAPPIVAHLGSTTNRTNSSYFGYVAGTYGGKNVPTDDGTSQGLFTGLPAALDLASTGRQRSLCPRAQFRAPDSLSNKGLHSRRIHSTTR